MSQGPDPELVGSLGDLQAGSSRAQEALFDISLMTDLHALMQNNEVP